MMKLAGVQTTINCLCVIPDKLHVSDSIEVTIKNTVEIIGKTAPMCCVRLYLSCIWDCLPTLWTIATSRLNWTEIVWNSDCSRVENVFSTAEFQRKTTMPFGISPAEASVWKQAEASKTPLTVSKTSLIEVKCSLRLCVFCLCLMGTMCCDNSWWKGQCLWKAVPLFTTFYLI